MAQPGFNLGPLTFHWYGIFIGLGLVFLLCYLKKAALKYRFPAREIETYYLIGLISSLIGGRIYHLLGSLEYYRHSPLKVLFVWEGGLGIFGAIIGGIIGLFLYGRHRKIDIFDLFNFMAPPLLLTQAIGRVGNFFNHEGFGPPTNLPWKLFIPIEYRPPQYLSSSYFHPTFFYESLLCLLAFLIFVVFIKKKDLGFAYYLFSYGIIRFLTEFFRWDTWAWNGFKVAQGVALGVGIVGLLMWWKGWQRTHK